ncbi:PREDICTED: uncharacterized protein LOC106821485, partial [Priapulus caudatus]|uniref:Uncharacterized protein LOC106821485 n=1 Tax=Priapulus caudatus TaxID=37621 RepID=A0ABM1FBH6_PRICU
MADGQERLDSVPDLSVISADCEAIPVMDDFEVGVEFADDENDQMVAECEGSTRNTQIATRNALSAMRSYCQGRHVDIDNITDKSQLLDILCDFYSNVRRRDGTVYSRGSMCSIKWGIARYFFRSRRWDIVKDPYFVPANAVFKAQCSQLSRQGRCAIKHRTEVTPADIRKLYYGPITNTSTPHGLQNKVWLDVMMYLNPGGRQTLRMLTKEAFIIGEDNGRGYIHLDSAFHEDNGFTNASITSGRMCQRPGNPRCPYASFMKYASKLSPLINAFWQRPFEAAEESDSIWYNSTAVGEHFLGGMMQRLSREAGLSQTYTNNCIKSATINTILSDNVEAWGNWNSENSSKSALPSSFFPQMPSPQSLFGSASSNTCASYAVNSTSASATPAMQDFYQPSPACSSSTSKLAHANMDLMCIKPE